MNDGRNLKRQLKEEVFADRQLVAGNRRGEGQVNTSLFHRLAKCATQIRLRALLVALGERPLSSAAALHQKNRVVRRHADATKDLMRAGLVALK